MEVLQQEHSSVGRIPHYIPLMHVLVSVLETDGIFSVQFPSLSSFSSLAAPFFKIKRVFISKVLNLPEQELELDSQNSSSDRLIHLE